MGPYEIFATKQSSFWENGKNLLLLFLSHSQMICLEPLLLLHLKLFPCLNADFNPKPLATHAMLILGQFHET